MTFIHSLLAKPVAGQFLRFAGIGALNTAVDFAVFNFFATTFGAYIGLSAGAIKIISFTAAVLHSYFWNKYWAFRKEAPGTQFTKSISQFIVAAVIGAMFTGIVIISSSYAPPAAFYAGVLAVLIFVEYIMWRAFHLSRTQGTEKTHQEFALFIVVSVIGAFINSGIVAGVTSVLPPQFGLPQELWTNLIVVIAIGVSLVWNFAGYKLFVFRR